MSPSGAGSSPKGKAVPDIDPGFRALVASLHRAIPPISAAREAKALDERLGAVSAPPAQPPARQLHDSLREFEALWPPVARQRLDLLSDTVGAVCRVWGQSNDLAFPEVRRAEASLLERRDAAVRLASALLYSLAREARIGETAIDQVASTVAGELGVTLFKDTSAVFSVPRGSFVEAEHEYVGPRHSGARIRALTFGIRIGGRVTSKASVEADVASGGAG